MSSRATLSFYEIYASCIYSVTDALQLGLQRLLSTDSLLNSGANGIFVRGTAKYTFAAFSTGIALVYLR